MLPPLLASRAAELADSLRALPDDPIAADLAERLEAAARGAPELAPYPVRQADRRLAWRVIVLLGAVWLGWLLSTVREALASRAP